MGLTLVEKKEFKVEDLRPFFGRASIMFLSEDGKALPDLEISVYCNGDHITYVRTDKDGKIKIEELRIGEFSLQRKTDEKQKDENNDQKSKEDREKLDRALFDTEEEGFSEWPFSDDGEVKLTLNGDSDSLKFSEYEEVSLTYQKITWEHKEGKTMATDDWGAKT